jgi:hypothetical protein
LGSGEISAIMLTLDLANSTSIIEEFIVPRLLIAARDVLKLASC